MNRPAPRGWCPSAARPMLSGDGLIVRLRPLAGRLDVERLRAVAALARHHGNGVLEVTSRASLQLRGVRENGHAALVDALNVAGLDVGASNGAGATVHPFWRHGDPTTALAGGIADALDRLPALPAKFGVALDDGPAPVLADTPADIRVERGPGGGLVVRADGAARGRAIEPEAAAEAVVALARWFLETGGAAVGRMRRHLGAVRLPADWAEAAPVAPVPAAGVGPTPLGPLVGLAFGQATADDLDALLDALAPTAVRLTPWRALLLEDAREAAPPEGFVVAADDPIRRVEACPGAPACASASVATRPLARALAGRVPGRLHVSGCAKGCAWPRAAGTVLVGREGRFDLVRSGHAWDTPVRHGLSAAEALTLAGDD